MDKVFIESGYSFDFSKSISAYIADKPTYNDLAAVDFVVEITEYFLFIEVKNTDNPKATQAARSKNYQDLLGSEFPYKMGNKYKDILLCNWVRGKSFNKPIKCIFVLNYKAFSNSDRAKLKEKISNRIPFSLNKTEFGGNKHLDVFELLTVDEFKNMFQEFSVEEVV